MIPKIIHYCWFGGGEMPELVQKCISTWYVHMQETEGWSYRLWNEHSVAEALGLVSFDAVLFAWPIYVRQAYEAKKYAFVSDYVRLWALEREGGLYMDVDFEVYKSFEPLVFSNKAFVGREGSKHQPPMLGVMASVAHGEWVTAMLKMYSNRVFLKEDGSMDLTTNVSFFAAVDVHKREWVTIYPVEYFCPILTTGEDIRTQNTYCEHKGLHSWSGEGSIVQRVKMYLLTTISPTMRSRIIKLKRRLLG